MSFTFTDIIVTGYLGSESYTQDLSYKDLEIPSFIDLSVGSKSEVKYLDGDPEVKICFFHNQNQITWNINLQRDQDFNNVVKLLIILEPLMDIPDWVILRFKAMSNTYETIEGNDIADKFTFTDIVVTTEVGNSITTSNSYSESLIEFPKLYVDKSDNGGALILESENKVFLFNFMDNLNSIEWRITIRNEQDRYSLIQLLLNMTDNKFVTVETIFNQFFSIESEKLETELATS